MGRGAAAGPQPGATISRLCGDRGVTMSVGAASYCPRESAGSWQRRADLAMYRAKRDGRNRTVLDDNCEHVPMPTDAAIRTTAAED